DLSSPLAAGANPAWAPSGKPQDAFGHTVNKRGEGLLLGGEEICLARAWTVSLRSMSVERRPSLTHDLFLPTLLFAALGGMTWAVRGCSGYGAAAGCLFAGVTWGAAWWFIAREPAAQQ